MDPDPALTDYSDEELAAAAAAGDPEAFEVLTVRTTPTVLRFVRRLVDDAQVAEDLTQETLFAVWRGLPGFAFRSAVRTWVLSIAHRKTVDHFRRRRDVPVPGERFAHLESAEPVPAVQAERMELREALRVELNRLPATSRAVWWLREAEGLPLSEIGVVLRISDGSVRGHLQRSRAFLATRLAPWKPDGAGEAPTARAAADGRRAERRGDGCGRTR